METKKKKIRHSLNALPSKGHYVAGDSLTTPDMSLSIPDILRRYTNGIAPPISHRGGYDNYDFDLDDPTLYPECDLSDIQEKLYRDQYANYAKQAEKTAENKGNDTALSNAAISESETKAKES